MTLTVRAALAAVLGILITAAPAAAAPGLFSGSLFSSELTALTASTYVVNSTSNLPDVTIGNGICETATGNGVCTLRAAVQESNASVGDFDTINFDIPGAAPHTINNPGVPLVTDPVAIDATTEPGFANSPVIELKGLGGMAAGTGLAISAGNSLVRGFAMNRFNYAIDLGGGNGNTIEGNYVGTDITGMTNSMLSNYNSGIVVSSSNNTIGGTTPAARNVLSGNGSSGGGHGVWISAGTGNVVAGNYIGLNAAGTGTIANANRGVLVQGTGNTVGGSAGTTPGGPCTGACNAIGGNVGEGIYLGSQSFVKGNFIGLNVSGTATLGNAGIGVNAVGSNSVVGGTTPEERNVIAGNSSANVQAASTGNVVQGNYIGTDPTGTIDRNPGGNAGVVVIGQNTIGGTIGTTPHGACTGACNLISGNGGNGISIVVNPNPTIEGNFIGLNASGTAALGNGADGINTGIAGNTIGGTTAAGRNVIAGNGSNGVELSNNNVLRGNYIGFSSDGLTKIPGGTWAVDVVGVNTVGGTNGVTPGGACTGDCNMILTLVTRANGTVIQGNFIGGVRPDGLGAASGSGGTLQAATQANVQIGGDTPQERNILSGGNIGVDVFASSVRVQGNYIGVGTDGTTPVPNTSEGIHIRPVIGALIGGTGSGEGNVIANNASNGVGIECRGAFGSSGHLITGNSIYSNGGLGIDICGSAPGPNPNDLGDPDTLPPNEGQNYPVLTSASVSAAGGAIVNGTLNSVANRTYKIDVYSSDQCDTSGFGEAKTQIGSTTVTTDGAGNASFNLTFPTPPNGETVITTTATSPNNSTSEISKCLSYARPKGGGPIYASLVPAYQECTSPNRQHAAPLSFDSCAPPARTSSYLTAGTPDANARTANFEGSVRYTVIPGDPATTGIDEADVQLRADLEDVRRTSDLADYTGDLLATVTIQLTDKNNGTAATEDATMVDYDVKFPVPCTGTVSTTIGSTCSATTTADAVFGSPTGVKETKRSIWSMGQVRVYDGGADSTASTTGDNTLYAVQGVFIP